eukprot:1823336-Pyramimonas_sp.AAC.1
MVATIVVPIAILLAVPAPPRVAQGGQTIPQSVLALKGSWRMSKDSAKASRRFGSPAGFPGS